MGPEHDLCSLPEDKGIKITAIGREMGGGTEGGREGGDSRGESTPGKSFRVFRGEVGGSRIISVLRGERGVRLKEMDRRGRQQWETCRRVYSSLSEAAVGEDPASVFVCL